MISFTKASGRSMIHHRYINFEILTQIKAGSYIQQYTLTSPYQENKHKQYILTYLTLC